MSGVLQGLPDWKLPSSVFGIDISGLYGADALEENATQKAIADSLARARFEDPKSDKKDSITGERKANFAESLAQALGVVDFSTVKSQANTLAKNKEATQSIQDYKTSDNIDFSSLSPEDRKDPVKVREFATKQIAERGFAEQGVTAVGNTTAEVNASGTKGLAQLKDEILRNSQTYKDSRGDRAEDVAFREATSDRNFGLNVTQLENQNSQAIAALQAQIETAKMQNEQSILDREYLDRRDLRDYNYKIKQDQQESLDKIFALILGGVDKMF